MPFLFNQQTCRIIIAQVDGYYKPTNALCSSCALVDDWAPRSPFIHMEYYRIQTVAQGPTALMAYFTKIASSICSPGSLIQSRVWYPARTFTARCLFQKRAQPIGHGAASPRTQGGGAKNGGGGEGTRGKNEIQPPPGFSHSSSRSTSTSFSLPSLPRPRLSLNSVCCG